LDRQIGKAKKQLAEELAKAVMRTLDYGEESVSVAFEERAGLDRTSLQAGHSRQAADDLQEAGIYSGVDDDAA
jgi:phenylpyruvate tautomerase PptA (4-oxalocrotonate tautomerase family)